MKQHSFCHYMLNIHLGKVRFSEHMIIYHKGFLNAKAIMNDFSQGGQAVGGAGGVAVKRKNTSLDSARSFFNK